MEVLVRILLLAAVALAVRAEAAPAAPLQGEPTKAKDAAAAQSQHHRVRRQNGEVVESIFQIPIQTLMAVSKVFTTGIQSFQRQREQFFQATRPTSTSAAYGYVQQQQPSRPSRPSRPSSNNGYYSSAFSSAYAALNNNRPGYAFYLTRPRAESSGSASALASGASGSHASNVAGVSAQSDGSSYRI